MGDAGVAARMSGQESRLVHGNQVQEERCPMSLMRDAIGVLLAGGQGERLWPLTRDRAKPAVPFGGVYRIIDITPPQMRVSTNWYLGTADAVYQNIYSIGSEHSRYVVVLSGDHIYKMNYQKMLQQHVDSGADVTVATFEVPMHEAAGRFGVIETDANWRIVGFEEKPVAPKRSHLHPDMVNASMGVYVFNTQLLIPALLADAEDPNSKHDFGRDILPRIFTKYRVYAYNFIDENKVGAQYWRDVGTIEAYYEANMDLVSVSPVFNLYDKTWPLRTQQRQYPPAKFVFGEPGRTGTAIDSVVCPGCIISGGMVRNSVVSPDVRVNSYTDVDSSIIFSHV